MQERAKIFWKILPNLHSFARNLFFPWIRAQPLYTIKFRFRNIGKLFRIKFHTFLFWYIRGYSKKSVSWAVHLFFVYLYCCLIQKWCINNDWKYDFWYLRCLFYQVESILFHFQQLQIFVFQKFPWNTAKMVKNLQCLKTPQICYLTHAEHHAKNRTSLRGLDHDTLFF